MPVTGTLNQENASQEVQEDVVDNSQAVMTSPPIEPSQVSDNAGAEVSSTTIDPDPSVEETGQAFDSEPGTETTEAVQPTSSMDVCSDSLDGYTEPVSKSTGVTNQTQPSKGFQDAFAAFASASLRQEEQEKSIGVPGTTEESKQETVVAAAADSAGSSGSLEPVVSSAIDSGLVTTSGESPSIIGQDADSGQSVTADLPVTEVQEQQHTQETNDFTVPESQPAMYTESSQMSDTCVQSHDTEPQSESGGAADSVYFIQMTDESGQIVTSIIDPSEIPSYSDSVVYKQCMKSDGEIETTIVYSGGVSANQEEQPATAACDTQQEQQIIYAHDLNGQLTPIDSSQSANDVAPPGKQFVYMQDSTGRIIRTIMDANQTMVPGQQVYYTQSEDGRIITSVMDSATAGVAEESHPQQPQDQVDQQTAQAGVEVKTTSQQQAANSSVVGSTAGFNIDNSMSGLSMLAELSHLTAGQAPTASGLSTEPRTASSTDSNSMDMDEFRPVAMVTTRQTSGQDAVESVSSDISTLKVGETDSDNLDQVDQNSSVLEGDGAGQQESILSKIVSEMKGDFGLPSYTVSRDNLFVQWQNLDAMCWMDVVLIMLVYSPTLRPLVNLDPTHELASTLLITLLKANRQAQVLLQNLLKKSNGAEISSLQTGAGNTTSMQDPKTSKLVCKENMDEIGKAINILYAMREKIWQALQPRLRCERGKHNSPVLVLPLLVREKPAIKQMFTMNYRYVFKCEQCGYSQDDSHTKILPSIPAVPADFNMKAPCFVRNCFECQAPNQRMLMKFEGLQDFVQMHFVKGLPHSRFEELCFDFNGDHYEVTAVVHYKNNPDHFIAWVRNAPGTSWMECDDLKSVITRYLHVSPNIPPSQVHLVMWERRLTPKHTLVMRDTEDTKVLASLVLTVQQPTSHQSTDPAAKPTGIPSGPVSTSQQSSQASTLLSGLMSQTQTFSPYTPRGRGRGRGSRGSYGSRGRGALMATSIRKNTPPITQISSPSGIANSRPRTSPQIVRLPLSALQSSGLNLRGSAPGGARYVFVGNSSQSGSAAGPNASGTRNKVVVVRSQGGSSNISASQILQFLRSGAISQAGSRISTTMTTTSATSTTSYVIQPDGTVLTTTTPTSGGETSTNQVVAGQQVGQDQSTADGFTTGAIDTCGETGNEQNTEALMETDQGDSEHADGQWTGPAERGQQVSTLPFSESLGTSVATTSSPNDVTVLSPESVQTGVSREATTLSKPLVTGDEAGGKVESQQQPSRYIQIPNPAGGGHILTQLVMRGGKMVLVPVDKNTAADSAPVTSVLKLPSTPSGSPKIAIRPAGTSPQIVTASSAGASQSQLLQQQPTVSSVSLSPGISTTTVATASPRFITIPSGVSGKRTIQLITVPRGTQAGQKTIIMSPPASQAPMVSTASTRLITTGNSEGRVLSKSGNIVIRELKRSEEGNNTNLSSSLGTADVSSEGSVCHLTSTPAVSLLRDVSARSVMTSSSGMTSLLTTPPGQLQKSQDSFKYILPGSSTTHILHTGLGATQGQSGRAFTALSSSGTIIGGQLTPAPSSAAIGTSPMDQDSAVADSDDSSSSVSLLTQPRTSHEFDTQEYIPLGRGRGRGRGGRGSRGRAGLGSRGRGGRVPRGTGRSQSWSTPKEMTSPGSGKISTLSDLRQIGAHVIESSSEAVDGVPVVSIPEFSASQTEAMSAAESIEPDKSSGDQSGASLTDSLSMPQLTMTEENMTVTIVTQTAQGPRVITQPIPSIKANHGFDILTQGILGSGGTPRPSVTPVKQGRSLLTGSPAAIQPAPSLLATTTTTTTTTISSTVNSSLSPTDPGLEQSLMTTQSEIDTLIQAAQAAAKPSKPGTVKSQADLDFNKTETSTSEAVAENIPGDFLNQSIEEDKVVEDQAGPELDEQTSLISEREADAAVEERVVSVDDSHVSAAERYRMPMELFQPDEESPEKPVKTEEGIPKDGLELPTKLFQDCEMSSVDEEKSPSPLQPKNGKDSSSNLQSSNVISSPSQSFPVVSNKKEETQEMTSVAEVEESKPRDDMDVETEFKDNIDSGKPPTTKRPGRSKGHVSSKKKGRRKSDSLSALEPTKSEATEVISVVSPTTSLDEKIAQMINSPKREAPIDSSISVPVSGSNGGFATDLLQETYGKETHEKKSERQPKKISQEKSEDKQDTEDIEEDKTIESQKDVSQVECDETEASREKESNRNVVSDKKKEKLKEEKDLTSLLAFVPRKQRKADWCVDTHLDHPEEENIDLPHPSTPFSYHVLTGFPRKRHPRHPSLGPASNDLYSPPSPMVRHSRKMDKKSGDSAPAVVKRRKRKALQMPAVDPSKEPTVIPLVAEESDPACTGGSVVTSPADGEIFTGVIIKHRQETADWSCTLEEDEPEAVDNLTGKDLQHLQRKYCKQLLTVCYMQAGDFSMFLTGDESQDDGSLEQVKEEETDSVPEEKKTEPKLAEVEMVVKMDKKDEKAKTSFEKKKQKKRGRPSLATPNTSPRAKKSKTGSGGTSPSERVGDPTHSPSQLFSQASNTLLAFPNPSTSTSTRINGIGSVSSPTHTYQEPSDVDTSDQNKRKEVSTAPLSMASPSRRSGRTPIPSKRVLDALEDTPVRAMLKDRRASLVSSDEEQSCSGSGDVSSKKAKQKTTHTSS